MVCVEVHGRCSLNGLNAWAEAVCRVLVEAIEEMQRKLEGLVFDVQMNGFSPLIQLRVLYNEVSTLNKWLKFGYVSHV